MLHFQGLRWYQRLRERAGMMGQHGGNQDRLFYSFNLDEHVPADHLLRGIDRRDMNEKPFPGVQGFAGRVDIKHRRRVLRCFRI